MIKMWFYLLENMHEKPLGFGRIYESKKYFLYFEMRNFFEIVLDFFKIREKNQVFLILNLYLTV
jgi:hypothetical protein